MTSLIIPSNENGIVFDQDINGVIREAIAVNPFGFEDVIIYSHGWSTDADSALDNYAMFSVGLSRRLLLSERDGEVAPGRPPRPSLDIGIHWPSEITEDPNSPLNDLQLFTFYSMEHRADAVGKNLVYSILRIATKAQAETVGLRFLLLGHSFGCKVICAALQDLYTDTQDGTVIIPKDTAWRVVLLEPATDHDNLEPGDIYGGVCKLDNLRLLMTMSQEDTCLTKWFPDAGRIANLFHGLHPTPALGAAGPTPATINAFSGATSLSVDLDFQMSQIAAAKERLVVADLTPAHKARLGMTPPAYSGGLSGSHSDINFDAVYNLVGGFLYSP